MATVQVSAGRPSRVVQTLLMVLAVAVGVVACVLVALNRTGTLPADLGRPVAIFVAIAIVAVIVVNYFAPYADPVILPVATALTGIGLAGIYSLDLVDRTNPGSVATRQLMFVAAGLVVAAVILIVLRDHRVLQRYTYTFGFISIVLLLLPMLPYIGVESYGARIWINLLGFQFQPGEFVKVTLAVFFAGYLVANRDKLSVAGPRFLGMRLPRLRDLGPIMVIWLLAIGILVFQRDLGTSLLFFGLFVAMLYVATNRVSWLVLGGVLFIPSALILVASTPHARARFDIWINAFDPNIIESTGGSYQLVQGLFGLANGGLLGAGWGRGYPEMVPLAQSDFILAALGEQLGLVGMLAILMLYLILIQRGLRAALGSRDGFGKLLATGLSFSIALQLFVVLGGITRVIPITGLTAPFLAAGGSSMIASWMIVALLLRISDGARRPAPKLSGWNYGPGQDLDDTLSGGSVPTIDKTGGDA